jgi:hypothetical protein
MIMMSTTSAVATQAGANCLVALEAQMACGDGACLGCGEKTDIHLFTGVVTALLHM